MSITITTPANDNQPHLTQGTGNNIWYTPSEHIELARAVLGTIDLDPASDDVAQRTVKAGRYFTDVDDSLEKDWFGKVWLNPPYARGLIDKFVEKLCWELETGRVESAILLTNNSSETSWFIRADDAATAYCSPDKRIKFNQPSTSKRSPLQGQTAFYYGDNVARFAEVFGTIGRIRFGLNTLVKLKAA